ncbi:MAG: DNA starvation/stationary phase protection protein [Anaerolineae bacterium]|nr:DNA starvation/stationary phase protection protein [Anaerolineae bacterium]
MSTRKTNGAVAVSTPKLITPNIGLSDASRRATAKLLNVHLANVFVLYTKTRNYHWNIVGMQFQPLHGFFEEQYDALAEAMDEIAERVRQVGGVAAGTLEEFSQLTTLDEEPGHIPSAHEMVANLLSDHEQIIRDLRKDVDTTAEEYKDVGTSDFLTGLMEQHEKMAWMLRAFLEG